METYLESEHALWEHYGLTPSERFVDLDSPEARLRVLEIGSGPPIMFIHGTGGIGPYWGPLVRELRRFRCLIVDRPGWGPSSPIDFSAGEYKAIVADVVHGVLDALGIERAHLVGASIGDLWALRMAQRHPDRVDRIVLMGGGPLVPEVQPPTIIKIIASPLGAVMVRMPEKPARTRQILRQMGHAASLDAGRIPDEYIEWRSTLGTETDSMRHERDMVKALVKWRRFRPGVTIESNELAALPHPTLLVMGTEDEIAPLDVWRIFVNRLPAGRLHLIESGGHLPWLDAPTEVGRVVTEFLDPR